MRWLIQYLRSCFCKHDFECITRCDHYWYEDDEMPHKHTYIYRCSKCGYTQKIRF